MIILGWIIIIMGVACLLWGDKEIDTKGGEVIKLIGWKKGKANYLKWPIGLALIYAGVSILMK